MGPRCDHGYERGRGHPIQASHMQRTCIGNYRQQSNNQRNYKTKQNHTITQVKFEEKKILQKGNNPTEQEQLEKQTAEVQCIGCALYFPRSIRCHQLTTKDSKADSEFGPIPPL